MVADAIACSGVSKLYGTKAALDEFDFNVAPGQSVGLIGHNGAGKTTLMKLALGLTRPSKGTMRVLGEDPVGHSFNNVRRSIGYLPENVAFHGGRTGRETLYFYARLKGVPLSDADKAFGTVGLEEAAGRAVRTYSKGMRQRLGLAQALLGQPRMLVFDEPTSGLDPQLRDELYAILRTLRADGVTVIVSSHALSELEGRLDRIAVMQNGRLLAYDTLDGLRAQVGARAQIRVSVAHGTATQAAAELGDSVIVSRINDRSFDLNCTSAGKVDVLRRVAALSTAVHDIEVNTPPLNDIYRQLVNATGPQ